MCSFWNVECIARAGDLKQARFYFEKNLGYASNLGLYSEELGLTGEQLGNYPQAFTHLGLISAAYIWIGNWMNSVNEHRIHLPGG